jgi:hypothetical protein
MLGFYVILFLVFVAAVTFVQLDGRHGYRRKFGWIWEQQLKTSPWWAKSVTIVRVVSGIAAAGLFLGSLTINICTWEFSGIARYTNRLMWMHAGVLLVFIINFAINRRSRAIKLSKSANRFLSALFIYYVILFASGFLHSIGKHHHTSQNGEGQSASNSHIQLEMDSKGYSQEDLRTLQTFSALWMAFSFVSAAGLLRAKGEDYKGPFGKYNPAVQEIK